MRISAAFPSRARLFGALFAVFLTVVGTFAVGAALPHNAFAHEVGADGTVSVQHAALLDGMLVRSVSDARTYYLHNGQRRLIVSPSAFTAQGFSWADVTTVGDDDLAAFPNGEPIATTERLNLPVERGLLPDLAPLAPYDIRYVTVGGRTQLKFTATFWNRGRGQFELQAIHGTAGDGNFPANQNVFRADRTTLAKPVGTLFWHTIHNHYHYDDFGEYVLELVRPAPGVTPGPSQVVTQKTTFCMRDDTAITAPADGTRQPKRYGGCTNHTQGVGVGWADVYPYTLPDQMFDVTDVPAGVYKMTFRVDHEGSFYETRRDNNNSATLVDIDPAKRYVKVLASASPFVATTNVFADGMLIRGDRSSDVFVMHANRKHLIPNEEVFASYGYRTSDIVVLPQGAVNAIPSKKLVRLDTAGTLYFLNDAGFRRRVLNPEVLTSYGLGAADIAVVNAVEFNSYMPTDIIKRANSDRVYSIVSKTYIGTMRELAAAGRTVSAAHVANDTDFRAYAVEVVQNDFNVPWDIAFLPDGDMLVTERPGTLRRIGKNPQSIPLPGVNHYGEGGLMGIALHPNFAENKQLYMYYTAVDGGKRNRIVRYLYDGSSLIEDKVITEDIPSAIYHDGGRIVFGKDGMLYVTTGDANTPSNAQNKGSLAGKTLRFTPDGGIPSDNPFGTAVWSYGHRNSQGIAWDQFGHMWETEHGRSGVTTGYDELNLIVKGGNYGWPDYEYYETAPGMTAPIVASSATETWAPGSITYADGSLWFAGLRGQTLYEAVPTADGKISAFRKHLVGQYGRLRTAAVSPDGNSLYVTTSNRDSRGTPRPGDDKLLRVYPAMLR